MYPVTAGSLSVPASIPSGVDEGWRVRVPPIPEPATFAMMMGLGGLLVGRRQR